MPPKARRTRTEEIDRVLGIAFEGEDFANVNKLIAALGPQAQELLWEELAYLKATKSVNQQTAERMDFCKQPPSIQQFIEDDYYLGLTLRPSEENVGIYPAWKDILVRDFSYESRIHNAVITGSLGIGKSWIAVAILLYRIVLTTLLRNPQNYFGISRGSNIIFNILSVTREQVRQTAFGDAINFMTASKYFLEELRFDPEMEYSKSVVPFNNNLFLTAGSKGWHILGRNVLGVLLDEGNFRLEKDPDQKAYQLYDQVRTRLANRFQKIEGFLPAISILASSASDESSFTEAVIRDIERVNNPKTQAVYRQAVYQVKRHELKLGKRWFRVAYGLRNMEPCLLAGWCLEDGTPIEEEGQPAHESVPKGAKIELVPEMYWPEFRRNCRVNLQSVSGISTGGSHRLFSSMVDVERCIERSEAEGVPNPLKEHIRYIPVSVEDKLNVWDYLAHSKFLTRVSSRVVPIRHPNALRYAHMDLATTTKAGLAICHLVGGQRVDGIIRDGMPFDEYRLQVEYDFILTITAGQVKPINFDKVCKFFFWLRDMCSFRWGLITADQYGSIMPLQVLEAAGFKVEQQSLDKNKSAYVAWRTGFEDLRMRLYRSEEMLEEAEKLMEGDKKFDHPDLGSKDTTDACLLGSETVMTLDGSAVALQALRPGQKCWVYSFDKEKCVVAGEATALGITRRNTRVLRVGLDTGHSIACTPDHRFMLIDGAYTEAQQLVPGARLMPFSSGRTVKSVQDAGLADVTCLRVPELENFALSAGVFVHNCAGAYFNAINSEERTTLLTQAVPSVYGQNVADAVASKGQVMELPMPSRTYRVVKEHVIR